MHLYASIDYQWLVVDEEADHYGADVCINGVDYRRVDAHWLAYLRQQFLQHRSHWTAHQKQAVSIFARLVDNHCPNYPKGTVLPQGYQPPDVSGSLPDFDF